MVLEAQVGFAVAALGVLGCLLFLVEGHVKENPGVWGGFFVGVLTYNMVHDLTDALLTESLLRTTMGSPVSLGLVALGLLLGWSLFPLFFREEKVNEFQWRPTLLVLVAVLALHAAVDGVVVGGVLRAALLEDVLRADTIALQVVHRALEGGVLALFLILAGVARLRIFAATFYVGLPLLAMVMLVGVLPFEVTFSITLALSFALAGAFLGLLLLSLWPILSRHGGGLAAVKWILLGFLVTLGAHAFAH